MAALASTRLDISKMPHQTAELNTCYCDVISSGAFCPLSHPHAYNGGKDCCESPWRDLIQGNSTCDGNRLKEVDTCCPERMSVSCNADSTFTCKTNPKFGKLWAATHSGGQKLFMLLNSGYLCPPTHPYPCQNGRKCSKTVWKPSSGNESDCDGTRLTKGSVCCHPDGNVTDCNGDSR